MLFTAPLTVLAQSEVIMVNHDTIVLDACTLGGGVIYDDGGAENYYSNYFDGSVLIQASSGISIHLTGNYNAENCCDHVWVYDGNTLIVDGVAGTGYIDATATSGSMLIRFQTDGSSTRSGFALTWTSSGSSASCANPVTNLHSTTITTSSLALSWNATSTSGPFTIICNGNTVGTATNTSYTLTDLNAASYYEVTVVATAAMGNRCCAATLGLRTACGHPYMPYEESFEGLADGAFPPCWLSSVNYDEEDYLPQVVQNNHISGERSLLLSCGNSESAGHFGMVATPPLNGSGTHLVRFSMQSSHSDAVIVVGTCDSVGSDNNAYGFTPIQTITSGNVLEWRNYSITWNATSGRRLAFRMEQNQQYGVGRRVYIDGVFIEDCGIDSLQVYYIDYNGFTCSWNTFGSPTCTVGVRPEGAMVDSLTFTNAVSPLNITGLGANRRYIVTVYPTCTHTGISRSVAARTSAMPTAAATFCSNFSDMSTLPQNWTLHHQDANMNFNYGDKWYYGINYSYGYHRYAFDVGNYNYSYGKGAYMVSELLSGLAGKQIAVDYYGGDNDDIITIGTMYYPDDTTSFVPLASDTLDGGRHTLVATVPANSTGRHIAVRIGNLYYWGWLGATILGVQGGVALVDSVQMLHRRGTSVEFGWAKAYDTVLIQYGPRDFTIGTGSIDTFYHARRGTVTGLTPSTEYDFYVYRPATAPCRDFRYQLRTAQRDYPLPYCENFNSLNDNAWNYEMGDWQRYNMLYNYPMFASQPYDSYAGNALQMASWGFNWDNYTVVLPDVEIDTGAILSFYFNDNAPQSTLIIGVIPGGYDAYHFQMLDSIHVIANHQRVHINYELRPSDTLFNGRLAIRYYHPYEYSFYTCYIDELQIGHSSYDDYHCYATGYTTAGISFGQLIATDSALVTIIGGGSTIDTVIDQYNVSALGLTGLDTGTMYRCYIHPNGGGCTSYAGYFFTRADGFGNGNCFPFTDVLSYELPGRWAGSGTMDVTNEDYLRMAPNSAVATHPLVDLTNVSFAFRARSNTQGDTLLLGYIPADSIHVDSTHFNYQAAWFTPIDTFVLGTDWQSYMLRLPNMGTDTIRMTFVNGSDTVGLDDIGFSGCPIVHFTVDGNTLLCKLDDDQQATYYLYVNDSAGDDSRVILVDQNSYRLDGLRLNRRYDLSWICLYGETDCRPTVSVRTGGLVPLPYCEDFDAANGLLTVPPLWEFYKANANDEVRLDSWGPSLLLNPNYSGNRWEYAILPAFDADSALSLHAHLYCNGRTQIGYLTNGTDTSSFVPLWSSPQNSCWEDPEVDFSAYTNKRIAIRTNNPLYIFRLHVYGLPLPKISLIASRTIKVTSQVAKPYWLHYRNSNSYYSNQDTTFYIDTTVFYIHDSNITSNNHVYINQIDSAGYTCESNKEYYLSYRHSLPYCYNAWHDWIQYEFRYQPCGHNATNYIERESDNLRAERFYGNSSSWVVMRDFEIDSIRHAGMIVRFDAGSVYDTMVVGVMEDAYDTLTFVPVDTLFYTREDDSIQSEFIDFSNYTGNGRWITFHHLAHENAEWFDIRYIYVEKCPGALGAKASLSRWNQVKIDGPKTPFYVEYHHTNESCQGCGNTILRIDSVPQILILDPETTYDFYFRCDSNAYTCVPAQRVTTLGAPLEVPSCSDFDTIDAGSVLHNWTIRHSGIGATNSVSHSGANSMQMPIGVTSYLITPDINIDSIQKVALSIWYQVEDLADRLVVGVMSDPYDMSTFHPIRTLAPVEVGKWQHSLVDFRNAPDGAHFIALRARSNRQAGGRSIYVDDFYVNNCAAFDFSVLSLSNGSIDLTWSQVGNPNTTITVLDEGVVTNTYTNETPPLHIEPLTMLHYYTFIFHSECGPEGCCSTNYDDTLSVVAPEPGVGCINATDLASPQAVFYSGAYNNPYSHAGAINYGPKHPDSRHTVCYDTSQRDPRTGNQLRTIPEGYTSSVRLGNWSTNYFQPEAEGVIYGLYVDTTNFELLLLRYAAVLQDPLHASSDQPRFRMELLDTNYNIIDSACTSADFIADQSLGWHTADDGVLWKDWTAVGVDLSAHAGEQVYFRLTTYDCNEGSHYGYAYFTLECMKKDKNTVLCGDVDSNTLSAPEGFHYRWYTNLSNTTISTAQSIRIAIEDVTYYCEVSKLDNPNCYFLISTYGGTRYPMASFDTSMVIDSCLFYVTFNNTSSVSKDGINIIPGDMCETYYWDLGNDSTSTSFSPQTVYTQPGTYTVRLICGINADECQDTATMSLVLEIPDGMNPSDTTAVSICDNEHYTFYGQTYNTAGEYRHPVSVPGMTCDSIYLLQLEVRNTSSSDTMAVVCDSIVWRGQTYYSDGTYNSGVVGMNSVNCDSSINLFLIVHPTYDTTETIIICPYQPYIYRGIDYGGPAIIDSTLYTVFNCDSVVHVALTPRDSNFRIQSYYHFDDHPQLPIDSIIAGCAPSTLYVVDSTRGVFQWNWMLFTPDTFVTDNLPFFEYPFEIGRDSVSAYLTLVTTSTGDCLDTIGCPIFVFPSPVPDFNWTPNIPSILHPDVQFHNLSTPLQDDSLTYLWQIQNTAGGEFDTSSEFEPHYRWGEEGDNMAGDYTVQLIASWTHLADSFYYDDMLPWADLSFYSYMLYPAFLHTCIDTAEHTITITNEYLQFPNLVTPNGDGVNDTWEVVNFIEYGNYPMSELWIYDRTGALVYHVKNIRRTDQFWDPNATRSPDGTYFYRFMAEGRYGIVKRNGMIEVLR